MENIILIYNDTILCNQRILYKSFALDEDDGVQGLMERWQSCAVGFYFALFRWKDESKKSHLDKNEIVRSIDFGVRRYSFKGNLIVPKEAHETKTHGNLNRDQS